MNLTEGDANLSVYKRAGYAERRRFNDQLADENSPIGKTVSAASIRESSANIRNAILDSIVNNGHGAVLRRATPD